MSYIKREAVQNCLDNLSNEHLIGSENDTFISLAEAKDRIEEIPTADVVAVVRCKDCKWWKRMNGDKRLQCFHNHGLIRTTENDYCSRGERREE